MKKEGVNKRRKLVILSVAVVFVLVMSVWIGTLVSKNISLNKELAEQQQELADWQEKNAALGALVDEENELALMEEYARRAGYVYPDERVYIQGS